VRDGGGIKPDIEQKPQMSSHLAFYLQRENQLFHFANRLRGQYAEMPVVDDSIYADFCRESIAHRRDTMLILMKVNLEHDLDSLRDEVKDLLQQELELRYHFRRGLIEQSLKGDELVHSAVNLLADDRRYREILSPAPKNLSSDKKNSKGRKRK